jgi:hypothetical protein
LVDTTSTEDAFEDLRQAVLASRQQDEGEDSDAELASIDPVKAFCLAWPATKDALELLLSVLEGVGGAKLFARAAIGTVIVAGDATSSAVCGPAAS